MAYKFGTFVWFEVFARDERATKSFYTEVLGWQVQEMKMGDGSSYAMLVKEGKPQCGVTKAPEGTSSRWNGYLSVEDVDATTKAVTASGGKVLQEPMQIPTVGRFSLVSDPKGALLSPFHGESGDEQASTAVHWMELWTPDCDADLAFYQKAFGLTLDKMSMPGMDGSYTILKKGETTTGGAMSRKDRQAALWVPFVEVSDADATLARAKARKASVVMEPQDVPNIGRFGVFTDPEGAVLGAIRPAARP